MNKKYDIRDKYGRKIGTVERKLTPYEQGQAAGEQIIGVILLLLLGIGFLLLLLAGIFVLVAAIPNAFLKTSRLLGEGRDEQVRSWFIRYGILALPTALLLSIPVLWSIPSLPMYMYVVMYILLVGFILLLTTSLMLFHHDEYVMLGASGDNEWVIAVGLLTQKAFAWLAILGGLGLYGLLIFSMIASIDWSTQANKVTNFVNGYTVCSGADELAIKKVTVSDHSTQVDFRYHATGYGQRIQASPPNSPGAFYLTNAEGSESYRLTEIIGDIAIAPDWTELWKGDNLEFSAVFERIDESMHTVNIIEGESRDPDIRYFDCLNVPVR
ncbi:MAG: hypothetical protein KatS3mg050_3194 [Litorilinea sp.]|nr:MAG: hypothetical protein KatS3mg050_3194 [Litorilinea sp.]